VPDFRPELPASLGPYLEECDLILHAGDVTGAAVLERLQNAAPVVAVLGNLDGADVASWGAEETATVEVGGVAVGMIHDAGRAAGREERLRRRFPGARLIVFGHSHIPGIRTTDGVTFVNPGSPTWKRRAPHPTIAVARLARGRIRVELVELPVERRPGAR
jgi:putative phosphoesterase